MATREDIKKAILAVAGNPESGPIANLADAMADAVVGLDAPVPFKPDARDGDKDGKVQDGTPFERPAKETRVIKADEKR
jgi:hypothetical protein